MIEISISPQRLVRTLVVFVVVLMLGHFVGLVFKFGFGHNYVYNLVPLFDLRLETNFPTYYSALALLLSASLLISIAIGKRRLQQPFVKHWFLLALIFVYLSCDEIMSIHELSQQPIRDMLDVPSFFYFAWVIPFGVMTALLAIAYLPFLCALPARFRLIFVGAGSIYIAGAIGFESLSAGVYVESQSYGTPLFVLWYSLEELFEMVGIVVFIYGLSTYISSQMNGLRITIENRCLTEAPLDASDV